MLLKMLRDMSIRLKITIVVMFTVFTALIVAGAVIVVFDWHDLNDDMIKSGDVLSRVVGNSVSAALVFNDKESAVETITAMRANKDIAYISIFNKQENRFALYLRHDIDMPSDTLPIPMEGYLFTDKYLLVRNDIILDGEKIGTALVAMDRDPMRARMRSYITILIMAGFIASGIALLIMSRLQGLISKPILHLSGVAQRVSRERDYSLRVVPFASDETGSLYNTFNEMLARIQESNKALKQARDDLEGRVEERTRELQIEIAERKRAELEKAERLKRSKRQHFALMRIVRDPAISSGKIEESIELIARLSNEALETFRTSLWLFEDREKILRCKGAYDSDNGLQSGGATMSIDDYPILIEALNSDRAIDASDAENDPRMMELTSGYLIPHEVTSALFAGIRAAGQLLGMVCIEHTGSMRQWTFDEIVFSGELADQVAHLVVARERRQAEKLRKSLQEKLEKAERMEALGVLAGGVAHDLNNMIGPLVGYPELILRKLPDDSPIRRQINTIARSAKDAADVIQDLLTLARRGRYEMAPICLNEVVNSYLTSAAYEDLTARRPEVIVNCQFDEQSGLIIGSTPHLGKVVMNLIVNAYDAMPDGGNLSVTTKQRKLTKLYSGYADIEPDEYICLRVKDSGVGIAIENIEKIFEPYYSKKKMGASGSGLGLSVVYGIVKDHKGYYDVFSEKGEGTEFVLYFPVTHNKKKNEIEDSGITGGEEKILIVDDVPEQRDMAAEMLASIGYVTDTVANGREAVAYLKKNDVDLIILDMIMEKDFDGLDTFRKIIGFKPGQKALIISGFSQTDRVNEVLRLGAGGYVRKPYTLEILAKAVRQEIDKKAPVGAVS